MQNKALQIHNKKVSARNNISTKMGDHIEEVTAKHSLTISQCGDLIFPNECPYADYDTRWMPTFRDCILYRVTACYESSVLFAAREGWINCNAPLCEKQDCKGKDRSSYCYKRSDVNGWSWHFRCCRRKF